MKSFCHTVFAFCLLGTLLVSGCSVFGGRSKGPFALRSEISREDFPLRWHLGRVDPRFGVSSAQVKAAVERATHLWEVAAGKQLFKYDETQGMVVQLVFDERQQSMAAERQAAQGLDKTKSQLDDSREVEEEATQAYKDAKQELNSERRAFNLKLGSFNKQVEYWNASGGASAEVADHLEGEKEKLSEVRDRLEQAQLKLEDMRQAANRQVDEYNNLAETYRLQVASYNDQFRSSHGQTIGEYLRTGDDEQITVYAFRNLDHLSIVLAHELGHAIGLEHVPGTGSIMSAVETGESYPTALVLTDRDKHALRRLLGK